MAKEKTVQGELVVDEIAIRSEFKFDETAIATAKQIVESITIVDKKSFDEAWEIRQDLRGLRVGIDKERKRLTEKARSYTDMVNGVAKSILSHIEPVECEVVTKCARYETAEAEKKKSIELAKQQALQKRLDALIAVGHMPNHIAVGFMADIEFESLLAKETKTHTDKVAREEAERVEAKRIADEEAKRLESERLALEEKRKAERIELDRQRKEIEEQQSVLAEQRAKMETEARAQREETARQRREIEDKQAESNRIENERLAAIEQQKDEEAKAQQIIIDEQNRIARLEALKPDIAKLYKLANDLRSIKIPTVADNEAKQLVSQVHESVIYQAREIEEYCGDNQ